MRRTLLEHGAPEEIAWQAKPHIGTDRLRGVILSLRQEIERLGGEVRFDTKLTGLVCDSGRLTGVRAESETIAADTLVLAVGHSARDTFAMLRDSGLTLQAKPFSVGFRAEHLQSEIDRALYHEAAGTPRCRRVSTSSPSTRAEEGYIPFVCVRVAGWLPRQVRRAACAPTA